MFCKHLICILISFVFAVNYVESNKLVIKTTSGSVEGLTINVLNKSVHQFLGIPYAVPPVGSLRFAKPKPIEKPIEGLIDATKAKNSCIQAGGEHLTKSEDCLVLNIWSERTVTNTSLRPVMFWIYGGGLSSGSIFEPHYNGSVLATQGVVYVSVNYRLGPLGFLYSGDDSAPGDVGFRDQLLALKWVRDNIHLFGGDAHQITIFGESAGSWSVSAHLLSPLSKGLFKRAIMQSAALLYSKKTWVLSKPEAILKAKQLAKRLKCSDDKQWLECLRGVDAKLIIPGNNELTFPIEGSEFLPLSAQKAFHEMKFNRDLELMAGVTKDEGSTLSVLIEDLSNRHLTKEDFLTFINKTDRMFHDLNVENLETFYLRKTNLNDSDAIKWKAFDFFSDLSIKCPTYLFAKQYAERSSSKTNVFFYELTHSDLGPKVEKQLGIIHASDIDFMFGIPLVRPQSHTKEDFELSREMVRMWTDFAKTGKPDPKWPQLLIADNVTMTKELYPGKTDSYFKDLFTDSCDGVWKDYF